MICFRHALLCGLLLLTGAFAPAKTNIDPGPETKDVLPVGALPNPSPLPGPGPSINTVLNPTTFTGADLGQQIIVAAASCSSCTVDVPTGAWSLNTSSTAPAGIHLRFVAGAVVNIATGVTWTINSVLDASRYQIFSGTGTVSFATNTSMREIYPEWWGADPTGNNDSTAAWQLALNASLNVNSFGGTVSCPNANYLISNTLTTWAPNTATGPSILGPEGQNNNAAGGCSLKWTGVAGGTVLHIIGGHSYKIEGVNINGNGLASRGMWLDTAQQPAPASYGITSVARNKNVVTVQTATAYSFLSGTDVQLSGVADNSYNGWFPVWYPIDATHFALSQSGPNASSSGGTVASQAGGDNAGARLLRNSIYINGPPGIAISSCSITASVLSCTLASPAIIYPNQWVWITGSTDPAYNAYWKVQADTGANTFTAPSTYLVSEPSATTGMLFANSAGITLGSNELALINYSVCCSKIEANNVFGYGTTDALMAIEFDATANSKDYSFKDNVLAGWRIAFGGFSSGNFTSFNDGGSSILDAVFASTGLGTQVIANEEWEQNFTSYLYASLVSGSYKAATLGTSGQFEANANIGNGGSVLISGSSFLNDGYAPDGVMISTSATLTMLNNQFVDETLTAITNCASTTSTVTLTTGVQAYQAGEWITVYGLTSCSFLNNKTVQILAAGLSSTQIEVSFPNAGITSTADAGQIGVVPVINAPVLFSSENSNRASTTSIGNTYTFATTYVPVFDKNDGGYWAYGAGSSLAPSAVTSIGDKYTDNTLHVYALAQGATATELRYMPIPSVNPVMPSDSSTGFVKVPNNVPAAGWRNAANNGDDTLTANAADQLIYANPAGASVVPVENAHGSLYVPGTLSNPYGVVGTYQNLLTYSQFDSGNAAWTIACPSTPGPTVTADTAAVTDPLGGDTAEQFVAPAILGCSNYSSGQQQAINLTIGVPYTASIWMRGAVGGEVVTWGYGSTPYDVQISLTTTWTRYIFTATGATAQNFFYATHTVSSTIYVWGAQVEQAPSAGFYVHTTALPQPATSGAAFNSFQDLGLASAVTMPVCALPTGFLAILGCSGITSVTAGTGLAGGATGGPAKLTLLPALPVGETATTQAPGNNSLSVATTAFVQAAVNNGSANICRATTDITNTGSTTQNLLYSCTIPGNTLLANSQIDIRSMAIGPTGNTGTCNFNWYLAQSAALGGTGIIASGAVPSGNRSVQQSGLISMRNSLSQEAVGGTSIYSADDSSYYNGTISYASSSPLYLNFTAQNSVSADTCNLNMSKIMLTY
jgi:hypothetical protein